MKLLRRPLSLLLSLAFVTVAAVAVISSLSCRTGAPPPSLQPSESALEATRSRAVPAERKNIDPFLQLFRNFEPDALATSASKVYDSDVYFNDGFVELEGLEAVTDYLVRSSEHISDFDIKVQDVALNGAEVYLRWEMVYVTTGGRKTVAPGISHLRFGQDGRIIYHRDYWDASGALAMHVGPAAAILRAIRNRL